jgi:hypothetical protein
LGGYLSGFEEFGFGVLVNHCRGHQVAGGFGHGGQDSLRYPGAREPDRLLLAGWVVSRFGQGLVKAAGWTKQQRGQPDQRELASARGIYILLCNSLDCCSLINLCCLYAYAEINYLLFLRRSNLICLNFMNLIRLN